MESISVFKITSTASDESRAILIASGMVKYQLFGTRITRDTVRVHAGGQCHGKMKDYHVTREKKST